MAHRLKEQFLTIFVALGECQGSSEDEDLEVENSVHLRAYRLVDDGHRKLKNFIEAVTDGDMSLDVPRYELCADDVLPDPRGGAMAWGIGVVAHKPLDLSAAVEFKHFVVDCYVRAAEGTGVAVRYVDAEKYEVFEVTQTSPFEGV